MNIKIRVMTIAILFEDGTGSIDYYPYLVNNDDEESSQKSFLEDFMGIYEGNGIEKVVILKQSQIHDFGILDFDSMEKIKNTLKDIYPNMNESLIVQYNIA